MITLLSVTTAPEDASTGRSHESGSHRFPRCFGNCHQKNSLEEMFLRDSSSKMAHKKSVTSRSGRRSSKARRGGMGPCRESEVMGSDGKCRPKYQGDHSYFAARRNNHLAFRRNNLLNSLAWANLWTRATIANRRQSNQRSRRRTPRKSVTKLRKEVAALRASLARSRRRSNRKSRASRRR